jgi:hypothetical protein
MCAIPTTPWTGPNSSWTNSNSGEGVITSTTTGDIQPKPVRIPGSSVGAVPTGYVDSARAVYPVFDGVTEVGGVLQSLAIDPSTGDIDYSRYPASFWSNSAALIQAQEDGTALPTPALADDPTDFTNWHSAFQAEYIIRNSTANSIDPPAYSIGAAAIYMLDDKNRPVNLLALTLSDYAKLSTAEKTRFNDNLTTSGHLENLGLSTSAADKTALIGPTGDTSNPVLQDYLNTITATLLMTAPQKELFSKQIQMLLDEVNSSFAFNAQKIKEAAGEIMARFKIVDKFVSAPRPEAITITGHIEMERTVGLDYDESASSSTLVKTRVNSLDDGARMDEGIEKFIRAETEILNMKERRAVITQNSAYRDPNLDVPNLIFQLQLLYEAENKGVVDAGTEEFRQLHKLLEDYNVMQQLLSTTISYFDTGKTDEKRRFMNIGEKDDLEIDEDQNEDIFDGGNDLDYNDYSESYSNGAAGINVDISPRYHWSVLANYDDNLASLHRDFANELENYEDFAGTNHHDHEGDVSGKLSRQQMLSFAMFVDEPWASHSTRNHPIEDLYGATRPTFDLVDQGEDGGGSLKLLSKNAFDQFQTQISNSITILNQQNQIKQNDVENATKAQNRHFELGNNALRKMNDLLLMIGRM